MAEADEEGGNFWGLITLFWSYKSWSDNAPFPLTRPPPLRRHAQLENVCSGNFRGFLRTCLISEGHLVAINQQERAGGQAASVYRTSRLMGLVGAERSIKSDPPHQWQAHPSPQTMTLAVRLRSATLCHITAQKEHVSPINEHTAQTGSKHVLWEIHSHMFLFVVVIPIVWPPQTHADCNKPPHSKSSHLEKYDESQSCSQDTPVLFGERVRIWRPRGFSVVFIPGTKHT